MKFLTHLIKKHWFWAVLLLLVLWLLPKLVNAYAYLFQSAADFTEKAGKFLRIPGEEIAKVTNGIARVAQKVADTPILTWVVPVALFTVSPVASAVLSLWGILDFFKANETISITRTSSEVASPTPSAPAAAPAPLLNQNLEDFYKIQF